MAEQPTLETERLILRPFRVEDAPEVQKYASDREIARTTARLPHPYLEGMAEEWIATHKAAFEEEREITFAIVRRADDQLVGSIGLVLEPDNRCAEIGYATYRPFWGRGYMTEAARRILRYAFDELGLNRVHAHHFGNNAASGRIMQKIGMHCEGRLRQRIVKWGELLDTVHYAILARDYDAARSTTDDDDDDDHQKPQEEETSA